MSNGSEELQLICSLRVSVESPNHAVRFMLATDLWENLKEASSANQIKRDKRRKRTSPALCISSGVVEWRIPCLCLPLTFQPGSQTLRKLQEADLDDQSKDVFNNDQKTEISISADGDFREIK